MKKEKTIYTLKLHEHMVVNAGLLITRVAGGWIYGDSDSAVFVPFDNEFMEGKVNVTFTPEAEIVYEYQWLVRYKDGTLGTTDYYRLHEVGQLDSGKVELVERLDKYRREVKE